LGSVESVTLLSETYNQFVLNHFNILRDLFLTLYLVLRLRLQLPFIDESQSEHIQSNYLPMTISKLNQFFILKWIGKQKVLLKTGNFNLLFIYFVSYYFY